MKYKIVEHSNKAGDVFYVGFIKYYWWSPYFEMKKMQKGAVSSYIRAVTIRYKTVDLAMAGIIEYTNSRSSSWSKHEVIRGNL